jgi:hypothetical protein
VVNLIETFIGLIRIQAFLFVKLCLWVGACWISKDHGDISFNDQAIQDFTVIFWNVGNHMSNDSCISKKSLILRNTAARTPNIACTVLIRLTFGTRLQVVTSHRLSDFLISSVRIQELTDRVSASPWWPVLSTSFPEDPCKSHGGHFRRRSPFVLVPPLPAKLKCAA